MGESLSERIFKRGSEFLNVEYPIICGAMTWVSEPKLVAAVSNAGGLGCLAGGNSPSDILKKQIEETRSLTGKPFGVNLITIAPVYRDHLALIKEVKPSIVIFAGGIPRKAEIDIVKEIGAKALCFAANYIMARRMIEYGADALIIEGREAGGHIGHLSLSILIQEVLAKVQDIPVFVGGGIATGRMCADLLMMGAAGVQLGTRFVVAEESNAHEAFKKKIIKSKSRDAISTPQIDSRLPVSPVRALRNKGTEDFGRLQIELVEQIDKGDINRMDAQLKLEEFWMGRLKTAIIDGDVSGGSLMAGQSVGLVDKEMPAKDIIDELVTDIEEELKRIRDILTI